MAHHFTFGVTVAFTLNYIIGTGFLTLPWAFQQTGCLLGISILVVMTLFSMISACLIVENMARAALLSSSLAKNEDVEDVVVNADSSRYQSVTTFPFHDDGGIELVKWFDGLSGTTGKEDAMSFALSTGIISSADP